MKSDIQPFQMYGNLFFVGSSKVSVHIIKTTVGLVMIDTGYPDMYEQILGSMQELGLDAQDICAIFHSHGHIDHFGCTLRLLQLCNARTYISRIDNEIVNGHLDLSWAKELHLKREHPFNCDVLIEDGDSFVFGDTTIRCRLTPWHTDGVLSFFINVEKDGETAIAAMHGGVGMNTLKSEYLLENGLSFSCRETFRKGLHALAEEKVDIVMGNHPGQSHTVEKLQKVLNGESIVDPSEWKHFLLETEAKLNAVILSE